MSGWAIFIIVLILLIIIGIAVWIYYRNRNMPVVPTPVVPGETPEVIAPANPQIRYVKLLKESAGYINIEEVEVFSNGVNIAAGKPVTSLSVYTGDTANSYVPSNLTDMTSNFFHSANGVGEWALINLQQNYELPLRVVVTNRASGFWDRAVGMKVQLLDPNMAVVRQETIDSAERYYTFEFD